MFSGYLAIIATLLLWSGFFLSLRGGAISDLTPADIALTRFLLPALVLLPFAYRARTSIFAVPKRYLAGMLIGCGLPYLLVAATAMQYAPVADGSALIPGTLPLFVSGLAVFFFAQPLSSHRIVGLSLVIAGIGMFFVSSLSSAEATAGSNSPITGHLLFLLGSLMWAVFTICARVANLSPLVSAGFISLISSAALILLIATGTLDSHLATTTVSSWPWNELFGHVMLQGIGAGLVASFTYLHAISILGAERSAAFGSATPAIATLLAIPVFGEVPSYFTTIALVTVCIGSLIASNVFMRSDASLSYRPPTHK
ncbi:DMT family transporter [Vibrio paucivorans]|uniref:DMT family transporter n=1 Tax=Vibrio paucivorans TaxID=2829489 RepID=A0A9X3HS84_9VIBR|nr:DMT family transporter [Vibrio paucivorans]MCW8334780.1 DMT family transporter [Vibrio paucivorans]